MTALRALAASALMGASVALSTPAYGGQELATSPCTIGRTKVAAVCGTLKVPENRSVPNSRKIALKFVVLKASQPNGNVIYFNSGGPAQTLPNAPGVADGDFPTELVALRKHFDILISDPRGHGQSHPLNCDLAPAGHPEIYFAQTWDSRLLKECRQRLAAGSDLAQYNILNAVDDLEALRARLGYHKVLFDVFSWGTAFAFQYMKKYPLRTGAAALDGVAPPGIPPHGPASFAQGAQVSIDNLARECATNPACRRNFPKFQSQFRSLVRRLDAGPIEVELVDKATKRTRRVLLSKEVFADAIRHVLYNPDEARYIPYLIAEADRGNTKPLASVIDFVVRGFAANFSEGAFLSYTCSEDIPFITPAELRKTTVGWFGDSRVRAQQRACAIWNVPALPAAFDSPVRSSAPVLMVSGTDDPATPPQLSAAALPFLGDGHRLLVRNATHASELPCVDGLKRRFLLAGSVEGLDLNACATAPDRPSFPTSLTLPDP